jgi:hypothetical protein
MEGRGTRVLTPTDLQAVSGEDARAKTHFVIVDAVGVCESDKTDSRPLEKKPSVVFDKLMLGVALGKRDEDTLTTLAGRLARLDREIAASQRQQISDLAGRKTLAELSGALLDACAAARPGRVKGRSQAGRFADLVALVRFALEQQPVLRPFAESVQERFNEWLMDKAKAGTVFTPEQLTWLGLIRDHIATSLSIEPDDFDYSPFSQRGGLGRAHEIFGEQLPGLLAELNGVLVA